MKQTIDITEFKTISNQRINIDRNYIDFLFEFDPIVDIDNNLSSFHIIWTINFSVNKEFHVIHKSGTSFKCEGLMFTKNLFEGEGLSNILDLIQISMANARILFYLDNKDITNKLIPVRWTRDLKTDFMKELSKHFN